MRSTTRLVTRTWSDGHASSRSLDQRRGLRHLLEVVDQQQARGRGWKVLGDRRDERRSPLSRTRAPGNRRGDQIGIVNRRRLTNATPPRRVAIDKVRGHLDGEPCLAGAARPGECQQADAGTREQHLDAGVARPRGRPARYVETAGCAFGARLRATTPAFACLTSQPPSPTAPPRRRPPTDRTPPPCRASTSAAARAPAADRAPNAAEFVTGADVMCEASRAWRPTPTDAP